MTLLEAVRAMLPGSVYEPPMSAQQLSQVKRLKAQVDKAWAEFDVGGDDEHGWNFSDYQRATRTDRRHIHRIETAPWIQLAAELNVPVPSLYDAEDDGEPNDAAFEKLKRDVRAAHTTKAREWLQVIIPTSGLAIALGGLGISTLAAYSQHIFERDRLTLSVTSASFGDNNEMLVSGLVSNGGTRSVAIASVVASTPLNVKGMVLPLQLETLPGPKLPLPVIIEAGKMVEIDAVVRHDLVAAFKDPIQGRLSDPDTKVMTFMLEIGMIDASGQLHYATVNVASQYFGRRGVTGSSCCGAHVLLDQRRLLGSLVR